MSVDFPAPGAPDTPIRTDRPVRGRSSSRRARGVGAVVGAGGLDQRDGLGEGSPVAGADPIGQRAGRGHQAFGSFSRTSSITRPAASGMLVPGPNTATTPASYRKS